MFCQFGSDTENERFFFVFITKCINGRQYCFNTIHFKYKTNYRRNINYHMIGIYIIYKYKI